MQAAPATAKIHPIMSPASMTCTASDAMQERERETNQGRERRERWAGARTREQVVRMDMDERVVQRDEETYEGLVDEDTPQ
jgi:hypothetical protein